MKLLTYLTQILKLLMQIVITTEFVTILHYRTPLFATQVRQYVR